MPMISIKAATPRRNAVGSMPMLKASEARNIPTPANDADKPAAKATGPHACCSSAPNRIIGKSGSTHGDKVDNAPAA
jgi:hypothetical protein